VGSISSRGFSRDVESALDPVAWYPVVENPQHKSPEYSSLEDESSEDEDQPTVAGIPEAEAPPSTTKQPLHPMARRGANVKGRSPTTRRAQDCAKLQALNEALDEALKSESDADKVVTRKMKKYWHQYSAAFPEEMKIASPQPSKRKKIKRTITNTKSPSDHLIWKNTLSSCKEDLN
jgi:hypothetical protein